MRSSIKNKFNIHKASNNTLIVYRNHYKELVIKSDDKETLVDLEKYLRSMLPRDYEEYIDLYNIQEDFHLGGYIINLVTLDSRAAELFKGVRTRTVMEPK